MIWHFVIRRRADGFLEIVEFLKSNTQRFAKFSFDVLKNGPFRKKQRNFWILINFLSVTTNLSSSFCLTISKLLIQQRAKEFLEIAEFLEFDDKCFAKFTLVQQRAVILHKFNKLSKLNKDSQVFAYQKTNVTHKKLTFRFFNQMTSVLQNFH